MDRLLNVKEVAAVLGLSQKTIYNFVGQRRIPVQRVGRRIMFQSSSLATWLKRQAQKQRSLRDRRMRDKAAKKKHEKTQRSQQA